MIIFPGELFFLPTTVPPFPLFLKIQRALFICSAVAVAATTQFNTTDFLLPARQAAAVVLKI